MKKSAIALSLTLALGATGASAAAMTTSAFKMFGPGGTNMGVDPGVSGSIGGGTWSVASPTPFFGFVWTAHSGTTFGPGTYTFPTVQGGTYTNITVGAGQVGGHILFNWNTTTDIDVLQVWNVDGAGNYTSQDIDGNGIMGAAMIDGAFPGFSANFEFNAPAVPVPAAAWLFGSGLLGLVGVARRKKAA